MSTDRPDLSRDVRPFDVGHAERRVCKRLPGLQVVADRFAHEVASALPPFVGMAPSVVVRRVEVEAMSALRVRAEDRAECLAFRMPPLAGEGVLTIDGTILASALEVLFGGAPGRATARTAREPSLIEQRVLARIGRGLLDALREAWAPFATCEPVLELTEAGVLVGAMARSAERMLTMTLEVRAGEGFTAKVIVGLPERAIDGVREGLRRPTGALAIVEPEDAAWSLRLRDAVTQAPVDVSAELGRRQLRLREVLALKVGDVLPLGTGRDGPVVVRVGGQALFDGTPGVARGHTAVRIGTAS